MSTPKLPRAVLFAGALFASVLLAAVAKKTGAIDPIMAKRVVVAAFSGLLVILGNSWPKLTPPLAARRDPARGQAADRFFGWVFVLSGLILLLTSVLAPSGVLMPLAGVMGMAAFGLATIGWARTAPGEPLPRPDSVRGAMLHLFFGLFWAFGLFLADWLWGDAVAQWLAIGMPILQGSVIAVQVTRARGLDRA